MPTTDRVSLESQLKELQQLEKEVVGPISSSLNQYLRAKALHEQLKEKCVTFGKEISLPPLSELILPLTKLCL